MAKDLSIVPNEIGTENCSKCDEITRKPIKKRSNFMQAVKRIRKSICQCFGIRNIDKWTLYDTIKLLEEKQKKSVQQSMQKSKKCIGNAVVTVNINVTINVPQGSNVRIDCDKNGTHIHIDSLTLDVGAKIM